MEAIRDENHVTVLMWVSSVDWETPVPIEINASTGALLTES